MFLNYGYQGHNKCLNQWTGHGRSSYYKIQDTYYPKHLKCDKESYPKCREKYGTEGIMPLKVYKLEKRKKLNWQKFKKQTEDDNAIIHVPLIYLRIQSSRMPLSAMFDLIKRALIIMSKYLNY